MKIGLIGLGKLGKMVEEQALKKGWQVTSKISRSVREESLCDAYIHFATPDSVLSTVEEAASKKVPIVLGTSGWYQDYDKLEAIVKKYQIGLIWGANFSMGVNVLQYLVKQASERLPGYDIAIVETHRKGKLDKPSGTALQLEKATGRKVEIASVRLGDDTGSHTVYFDHPTERLELTHQSKNREAYALGALEAAQWIQGKRGIYSIEEMLHDIF